MWVTGRYQSFLPNVGVLVCSTVRHDATGITGLLVCREIFVRITKSYTDTLAGYRC
jgi:hypothetical protein